LSQFHDVTGTSGPNVAPPSVVGLTRSWQLTPPCLVYTPNPFVGLKKAMAVSLSLVDTGVLVEVVACGGVVVVGWDAGEADDEQPASAMADTETPTSKIPRRRGGPVYRTG
jgi:hypothetical protein